MIMNPIKQQSYKRELIKSVMKEVVIIGGGFAGSFCARKLEKYANVTLIDKKEYFEFTPSILRTLVEPEHRKKIHAKHKDYLKKANVMVDCVEKVTKTHIITKSNKKIKYDILVIAAGSRYDAPIKDEKLIIASRSKELAKYSHKLDDAKNILIVGGGFVGVELAAEIRSHYPNKKIKVVTAADKLLHRSNNSTSKAAERYFKKNNIQVLRSQRVTKMNKDHCVTDKNEKFECDLGFLCIGFKPNSEPFEKIFDMSKRGQIHVDHRLLVNGEKNVFACGDITSIMEEKTAQNANKQAQIVVRNIKQILNNQNPTHEYHTKPRPLVISLANKGIISYKNFSWYGRIPGMLKWAIERKEMRSLK